MPFARWPGRAAGRSPRTLARDGGLRPRARGRQRGDRSGGSRSGDRTDAAGRAGGLPRRHGRLAPDRLRPGLFCLGADAGLSVADRRPRACRMSHVHADGTVHAHEHTTRPTTCMCTMPCREGPARRGGQAAQQPVWAPWIAVSAVRLRALRAADPAVDVSGGEGEPLGGGRRGGGLHRATVGTMLAAVLVLRSGVESRATAAARPLRPRLRRAGGPGLRHARQGRTVMPA